MAGAGHLGAARGAHVLPAAGGRRQRAGAGPLRPAGLHRAPPLPLPARPADPGPDSGAPRAAAPGRGRRRTRAASTPSPRKARLTTPASRRRRSAGRPRAAGCSPGTTTTSQTTAGQHRDHPRPGQPAEPAPTISRLPRRRRRPPTTGSGTPPTRSGSQSTSTSGQPRGDDDARAHPSRSARTRRRPVIRSRPANRSSSQPVRAAAGRAALAAHQPVVLDAAAPPGRGCSTARRTARRR